MQLSMVPRIWVEVGRLLTGCQVGAVGGGLANTVGGVTEGLGNTVKSGGNMAREGMSSNEGQGSAAGGKTAKGKTSKGVEEVANKNSEVTDTATQKTEDVSSWRYNARCWKE